MNLSNPILIAQKEASSFRRTQGLSAAESLNIESLLLQLNVLTVFYPLGEAFGMAVKVPYKDSFLRFILVNNANRLGRQHFTICHELYHLFIQKDFTFKVCNQPLFSTNDKEEYNADLFASYLLMPEEGLRKMILEQGLNLSNEVERLPIILKIEQYFGCSRQALLYRLYKMDCPELKFGSPLHTELSQNVTIQAQQYGYDINLYKPTNQKVIGNYGELSKRLFDTMKISEARYASLMDEIFVNIYTPQYDETKSE